MKIECPACHFDALSRYAVNAGVAGRSAKLGPQDLAPQIVQAPFACSLSLIVGRRDASIPIRPYGLCR